MAKSATFPFEVYRVEDVHSEVQNRQFSIQSLVGKVDGYYELFEEYEFGGNGPSWAEHIRFILEAEAEELDEHLEYDEEGDTFLVYADSQEIVDRFLKHVFPVFATQKSLKKYLKKADPDNFSEQRSL